MTIGTSHKAGQQVRPLASPATQELAARSTGMPSLVGLTSLLMLLFVLHLQKGRSSKREGEEGTGRGGRPVTWFGGGGMNPQ